MICQRLPLLMLPTSAPFDDLGLMDPLQLVFERHLRIHIERRSRRVQGHQRASDLLLGVSDGAAEHVVDEAVERRGIDVARLRKLEGFLDVS